MRKLTSAVAVAGLFLSGCATTARYEMYRVAGPTAFDAKDIDSYCLQATLIRLERPTTDGGEISITPVLVDDFTAGASLPGYQAFKIGMRRSDALGVRTNVNLTKLANSCIPSAAGVEVIDDRIKMLNTVGSIVKTIVPFVFNDSDPLTSDMLPLEINTLEAMTVAADGKDRRGPLTYSGKNGLAIEFGSVPPDALEKTQLPASRVLNGMLYSACRQTVISFDAVHQRTDPQTKAKTTEKRRYLKRVAVSDPAYVQFAAFPQKGTISFHSQCGVSVAADKETGVSSDVAVAEAFVNQAKAIKEALDASKKDE